jgi:hypothetical protein
MNLYLTDVTGLIAQTNGVQWGSFNDPIADCTGYMRVFIYVVI